jgi:hypothetical protein
MLKPLMIIATASLVVAGRADAHAVPESHYLATAKPYAPYEFLIGDWYTQIDQNTVIHQQFAWGPGKGSMNYATYFSASGKPEHLHFGGMMIWNGKSHALDYVFAVEPDSGIEEKGTFTRQPDGSIVREVTATYPDGRVTQNRQTFRKLQDGTISMDLLDRKPSGWASSLPAGKAIVMSPTAPQ